MKLREYPYLYLGSAREAKEYGELDQWRESHKLNIQCKHAIEDAIRRNFDGMNLNTDCVKSTIEEFGFKRVGWVLANTIKSKDWDGRFSQANKAWASNNFIPPETSNSDFVVESHPAVLDGFIAAFHKAKAELQMFDSSHCDSLTGQALEGKVLVMSPYTLKESYWSQENQLWLATGGFGCSPTAAGRAVYGRGHVTKVIGNHTRTGCISPRLYSRLRDNGAPEQLLQRLFPGAVGEEVA